MSDQAKVDSTLLDEIKQKHDLKHIDTAEKIVLPTPDDLKKAKVEEKIQEQIADPETKKSLNHVDPLEKNILPSVEQIEQEKQALAEEKTETS